MTHDELIDELVAKVLVATPPASEHTGTGLAGKIVKLKAAIKQLEAELASGYPISDDVTFSARGWDLTYSADCQGLVATKNVTGVTKSLYDLGAIDLCRLTPYLSHLIDHMRVCLPTPSDASPYAYSDRYFALRLRDEH